VCFRDLLGTTPERLGAIVQLGNKFAAKLHAKAEQLQAEHERDAANDRFYLSPAEMREACRR